MSAESEWATYRRLVMEALERHDRQYDKLTNAVGEIKELMSSFKTTLESVDKAIIAQAARIDALEGTLGKRVKKLEDDFQTMKIRIALIAGGAGAAGVGGIELLQALLGG